MTPADRKLAIRSTADRMASHFNDLLDSNFDRRRFAAAARAVARGDMTYERWQFKLRQGAAYRARFPGIVAARAAGLPPLDEVTYKAYERQYRDTLTAFGLPAEFGDRPKDFTQLFSRGISPDQFAQRMQDFHDLTRTYGGHVREAFQRFAGIDLTDADAYRVITGQAADLSRKYAEATGTELFEFTGAEPTYLRNAGRLSTVQIRDALRKAVAEEEAYAKTGGTTLVQPPEKAKQTF
jgi:hypothetical protein